MEKQTVAGRERAQPRAARQGAQLRAALPPARERSRAPPFSGLDQPRRVGREREDVRASPLRTVGVREPRKQREQQQQVY